MFEIPTAMKNGLVLIEQACNLNEEEKADLETQIITMGEKGISHYICHTNGRGKEDPIYPGTTGDRYWEVDYLPRAKTLDFITQYNGFSRERFVAMGKESLFYENLI